MVITGNNLFILGIFSLLIFCSCEKKEKVKALNSENDTIFYASGIPAKATINVGELSKQVIYYYDRQDTFLMKVDDEYYKMFDPIISKYQFFNKYNDIAFETEYSEDKKLKNKFGKAIMSYWASKVVQDDGSWAFMALIPYPPYLQSEYTLYYRKNGRNKVLLKKEKINNIFVKFDSAFKDKGTYEVFFISNIKSNQGKEIQRDSISFILKFN